MDLFKDYKIPSAVDMAKKIIKDNPSLFTDSLDTQLVIAKAMGEYYDACRDYVNQDKPLIERMKEIIANS